MSKAKRLAMMLLSLALLAGCSGTPAVIVKGKKGNVSNLCRDWRHMTVSKDDRMTEETASQIEASNLSRPNWGCKFGANSAK